MTKQVGDSTRIDTWAATGQKTEPLEAKKNLGWEVGERPANDFMNFIQNQFGQKINHILANGVPAWNATDNYEANAFVSFGGVIYKALTPNTASQPPSVNWSPIVTEASLNAAGVTRYASDAETQAGIAANRAVTPASLSSRTATETRTGLSAEATQAELNSGTGANKFVTAPKLRLGFSISLNPNGFISFPTWLGGLVIQWGNVFINQNGTSYNFPIPFPTFCASLVITGLNESGSGAEVMNPDSITRTGFVASATFTANYRYIAIGY